MNTRLITSALLAGVAATTLLTGCAHDQPYAEDNRGYRSNDDHYNDGRYNDGRYTDGRYNDGPTGTDNTWETSRSGRYHNYTNNSSRLSSWEEPTGTDNTWEMTCPSHKKYDRQNYRYDRQNSVNPGMRTQPTGTDDPWQATRP